MTLFEEREAQKRRWEIYREAAARLYPTATVRHLCAVSEDADHTGAFLEIVVWIPCAEIVSSPHVQLSLFAPVPPSPPQDRFAFLWKA